MIYLVCPFCRTDQDIKNKTCKKCGEVIPKDRKSYKVVVSYNYKRVVRRVPTLELAKEIEIKIKSELISGEYFDRKQKRKEDMLMNDFFYNIYLPHAKQDKKTWADDESAFRIWVSPIIAKNPLSEVSQMDIEKIKKFMADNNKSPRTIQKTLTILKHVFNVAIDFGYLAKDNPVRKVKLPKPNNMRIRFLTVDEANKFLDLAKQKDNTLYEMCVLSLYCGLRFGEIANLHYSDIDLENERLYIRNPKNQTARVVYMPEIIKEIMAQKKSANKDSTNDSLLYLNKAGKKYDEIIRKKFNAIVNQLGLNNGISDPRQKVVFHTLRHTFASWLAIQGTPIYTIKELMGHKSLAMTERYAHLIPDIKKEAVNSLTKNRLLPS
ncbi:MAG TPA: site-specific integrase [Desulfurella acetivorans]|nr:site-specific integrase [Desulfurella acetivorans]